VPKILGWKRPGKIGRCQIYIRALRILPQGFVVIGRKIRLGIEFFQQK